MMNPPKVVTSPTKTEQVKTVLAKTGKTISRERELVLSLLFLVLGFVMGRL